MSLRLWRHFVPHASTIVDVGAQAGIYALAAKCLNPAAVVVRVRAAARRFDLLKAGIALNTFEIVAENMAVSDVDRHGHVVRPADKQHGLATLEKRPNEPHAEITTSTVRLDDFVREQGLRGHRPPEDRHRGPRTGGDPRPGRPPVDFSSDHAHRGAQRRRRASNLGDRRASRLSGLPARRREGRLHARASSSGSATRSGTTFSRMTMPWRARGLVEASRRLVLRCRRLVSQSTLEAARHLHRRHLQGRHLDHVARARPAPAGLHERGQGADVLRPGPDGTLPAHDRGRIPGAVQGRRARTSAPARRHPGTSTRRRRRARSASSAPTRGSS